MALVVLKGIISQLWKSFGCVIFLEAWRKFLRGLDTLILCMKLFLVIRIKAYLGEEETMILTEGYLLPISPNDRETWRGSATSFPALRTFFPVGLAVFRSADGIPLYTLVHQSMFDTASCFFPIFASSEIYSSCN